MMGHKFPLVEPIHFLLGQREKLPHVTYNPADPPETQAEKHNFRDLENLWISINPQTGLITTAEMANVQDSSLPAPTSQGDDSAALEKQFRSPGNSPPRPKPWEDGRMKRQKWSVISGQWSVNGRTRAGQARACRDCVFL